MKKNFPITDIETTFSNACNILSTTDLKGKTTHVNDDFCNIAGFKPEELIGKNHNVVRHPDMPPAAFDNLWTYLKSNKPWMGLVKNRCKNGDFYWVDAFVMPIEKDGEVAEFQSVRFQTNDKHRERAEECYADINAGKTPKAAKPFYIPVQLKLFLISILGFSPLIAASFIPTENPLATSSLALAISLALAFTLLHFALQRFQRIVALSKNIYDNDLKKYIYTGGKDELSQIELAFKMTRMELRSIAGRFQDSASQIQAAAGNANDAMKVTTKNAENQQSEIHMLAATTEEMTASFQEVSRNCEDTSTLSREAAEIVNASHDILNKAISSNTELMKEIDSSTEMVSALADQSGNIASLLDVIKSIAGQTNLLALNAAIESARAGEQGRGFAVVADEVRTLAQRTQQSTEEIEAMLETFQGGTRKAVEAMKRSKDCSTSCIDNIKQSGDSMGQISSSIQNIANMSFQIAAASEEQSCVAVEISKNIASISDGADSTAEHAQEARLQTEALTKGSRDQFHLAKQFSSTQNIA